MNSEEQLKHEQFMKIAQIFVETIQKTFPENKGAVVMFGFVDDKNLNHNFAYSDKLSYNEISGIVLGCNGMIYNAYLQ